MDTDFSIEERHFDGRARKSTGTLEVRVPDDCDPRKLLAYYLLKELVDVSNRTDRYLVPGEGPTVRWRLRIKEAENTYSRLIFTAKTSRPHETGPSARDIRSSGLALQSIFKEHAKLAFRFVRFMGG